MPTTTGTNTENPKCEYCNTPLTDRELKLLAEAEDVTESILRMNPKAFEIMCDKCAGSDMIGPYIPEGHR